LGSLNASREPAPLGILGGTFDPVHNGHLRLAIEMRELLGLSEVKLVPALNPRLRDAPSIDAENRLRMLHAAVAGAGDLQVDDRELQRQGPSYTVDTLRSFREEFVDNPICLIVGMDAFVRFDQWHEWEALPELAHIAVAQRPGTAPPETGAVARLLETRKNDDPATLREDAAGRIIVCGIPGLDISATRIRALLGEGRSVRYLVPAPVHEILQEEND
jgi:nicotinate-nucleotide adenylyltransferase